MKPSQEITRILASTVPLFADFPADRLARLVDGSEVRSFLKNETVALLGDEARHLGVILSGAVLASIPGEAGARRTLGRLETGGTFGELALMTGDKVLADFVTDSPAEILLIPVALFQSFIVSHPGALQHLSRTVTERLKQVLAAPSQAAAALRHSGDPYGLDLHTGDRRRILVVNCGSSSLKYAFFDTARDGAGARGLVERIGIDGTRHVYSGPGGEIRRDLPKAGFTEAFAAMGAELAAPGTGVVASPAEIGVVVHRVVHGGDQFVEATIITDEILARIEKLSPLAPLHNPVNLAGIRGMRRLLPDVPHVAVFDTAFHHTLPPEAYLYGLPYEYPEKKGVRRYGFHGTSHAYASLRAAQFLGRRPNELEIVTCHLGNGSSLCAVDHGRSVDTTMGFTPAEGLVMGTRCGDVDAGVLAFLERTEGLSASQSEELLNRRSGLLGMSGISSDMREVLRAADSGHPRALLALKTYCYRVRKGIGACAASMGGLDAVVFTGGIGQGSAEVRALALQGLEGMGIRLDLQQNRTAKGFDEVCRISSESSPVAVLVVPADEERMMAREALRAVDRSQLDVALDAREPDPFPIEVSAHHIHLCQDHVEALFGKGHQLTRHADLSQPGQYACKEQLAVLGPKGRIERVRVLGPARKATQVEISLTEQFKLGVHPPVRESGDIKDTPGCTLEGPAGTVALERGVICALRHIHMTPADALRYGVRDKSLVRVRVGGDRELIFGDVLVRVDPAFALAMHIDTDEANAAGLQTGGEGWFDGIQSQS